LMSEAEPPQAMVEALSAALGLAPEQLMAAVASAHMPA